MEELDQYEVRMQYYGGRIESRNVKEIHVPCANCGKLTWINYQRARSYIRKGKNWFCSTKCASVYGAEHREINRTGKENAGFSWDKKSESWLAFWTDPETGKGRTTTKSHWLWEMKYGEVPDGYWVTYIDGNPANCELENLKLISRGERMSRALMGHRHSEETKQKLSDAHSGKILSEEHKAKIGETVQRRWDEGEFDDIHVGEHHHKWRGGVPKEYPPEFYKARKGILKRDKFRCRICARSSGLLHVHHINRNRNDNSNQNLITLCVGCHSQVHSEVETSDPEILAFRAMLNSNWPFD